ncbi:MAG TPA: hypothetical protein PLZ58_00985 [Candidatus Saccharibacteria bacterium]|nr:hypothetical protein [Candidatus Saccharibacteria bacterium]HRQ07104.1 hypothetical protein [Candidatus Saccharibacteria bacterium]
MKLLEHEAKTILSLFKIAVPSSVLVHKGKTTELDLPVVLKSQVPIGGRGKAGGIKVVKSDKKLNKTIDDLFKLDIKGFIPQTLLAEELLDIKHEYYVSMIIDRATAAIQVVAGRDGGVEVESNDADSYLTVGFGDLEIGNGKANFDSVGQALADYYDLQGQAFVLQDLVENLYRCFIKNDAMLIEINPLVLTTDDKLVAGDCKMELDDSASFRHDWKFEQTEAEVNFVTLDEHGTVATIANGAGLAMATVDAVANAGMKPANFLDIGGGANTESVMAAFAQIMEYSHVKTIVINIFAGITRCDEVAKAIIAARDQMPGLPKLCIRLAGTNYDVAKVLLDKNNIKLLPTLEACIDQALEYTS